ncbi:MAG: DUF6600 domain-containing protein [Pyrinomonadaceae bacterium]
MVNARANGIKLWPHLTVVFFIFAALGGVAAALWMRHEPKTQALAMPRAARVERVDGEVGLSRDLDADAGADDVEWIELMPNTPLTEGDRVYARQDSRASLAFTGRNFARLEPDSSLDVLSLSDRRTQLALREGSAIFDLGALGPDEMFEVATPYGAVDLQEPGIYEVGYNDDGSAFVSVLSGLAQVVGLAGSGEVGKGEMLTLLGQTAAQVALSRLSPDYAGGLLDDYYGDRYPEAYDGRYSDYNAYLNDPDYYHPFNGQTSYQHVPAYVPGAYDLDRYGDWQNLDGYGYAWSPRVEQGWAPYRDGNWTLDDPYGLTWVSNEPWGYAPYHYGRWASVGDRWYWIPEGANTQTAYAPALVAFLPATEANQVGWVPLAPGDPYAPAYYDANWQPHYVGGDYDAPERVVNINAPGGLTVVSVDDFGRRIDRDALARFDPRAFDRVRPLRDPLSHAALRQMSLTRATERRGFVLPPGLAKRLEGREVYASAPPRAEPFARDFTRRLRVASVPEQQKREKLKFKDERREPETRGAARGFEDTRRASREAARRERKQERGTRVRDASAQPAHQGRPEPAVAERVSARAEERARGERGGPDRQAQGRDDRRQRAAAEQQQHAAQQRANHEAARQAQQQQREMMRARPSQQRGGRGVERQQQQQRPAAQSAPPGQARKQQAQAPQGGGRPGGGGPPAKQQGGGRGGGGGKGKGKN